MISSLPEMRALVFDLGVSNWTLSAIAVLFDSGLVDHLREPKSLDELATLCPNLSRGRIERCLNVVSTVGVVGVVAGSSRYRLAEGVMPFLQEPMRAAIEGDIRSSLMQPLAFLDSVRATEQPGWRHTDKRLLQAQGDASGAFPPMFKANLISTLGNLAARFESPGARFLDIGVGVGSLSISMCRCYPNVHVVGVDLFDVPLAMARENVARAKLHERIELRQLPIEDLNDESAFDLAWFPSVFIPAPIVPKAIARVHAALRPGGWVLLPTMGSAGSDQQRAVGRLMNEVWGGPLLASADAEALFKDAGFSTIRAIPGPAAWAPGLVVAER